MDLKLIGAVFVIVGCGGVGFLMALGHKREISAMKDLLTVLDYMRCELEFRLTPLPELCARASRFCRGSVSGVLDRLSRELDSQVSPDVSSCVEIALKKTPELPVKTRSAMQSLGRSLGNFDLPGQLKGMESVRTVISRELEQLELGRTERLRSYQTLGLCAGAALVILFM